MTILLLLAILPAASALSAILRDRRQMEAVYLASAAAAFAAALWLAADVLRDGSISLAGGFLYADSLSALVLLLTAFVYLVTAPYAVGYLRHDGAGARHMYFWLTPLFGFAMFLVAVANNLGVMWVAVEGTTLTSIFLVTFYARPTSLEAAWKYAILGGVGLSMALFGTVLTYYSAHRVLGTDSISALNWTRARHQRLALRPHRHATGIHPGACWATVPKPVWRPCTPGNPTPTAKPPSPSPR